MYLFICRETHLLRDRDRLVKTDYQMASLSIYIYIYIYIEMLSVPQLGPFIWVVFILLMLVRLIRLLVRTSLASIGVYTGL